MPRPKEQNVVRLIEYVEKYPMLWNRLDVDFKNLDKKTAVWNEVARLCGLERKIFVTFNAYLNFE